MFLFTNRQDFFNDICEEIRLFLPGEEIAAVLSPAEIHAAGAGEKTLSVVLSNDGTDFFCRSRLCFERSGAFILMPNALSQ